MLFFGHSPEQLRGGRSAELRTQDVAAAYPFEDCRVALIVRQRAGAQSNQPVNFDPVGDALLAPAQKAGERP